MNTRLITSSLLIACCLGTSCNKSKERKAERMLIGTWLGTGSSVDKNANGVYDKEEQSAIVPQNVKFTLRFSEDHNCTTTFESGTNPPHIKTWQWDIKKNAPDKIILTIDGQTEEEIIEFLSDNLLVVEDTHVGQTTFTQYNKQ